VLIRSVSPILIKGGTRVFSPVSMTASLSWLVAVAPLIAGESFRYLQIDHVGHLHRDNIPFREKCHNCCIGLEIQYGVADQIQRNGDLVIVSLSIRTSRWSRNRGIPFRDDPRRPCSTSSVRRSRFSTVEPSLMHLHLI